MKLDILAFGSHPDDVELGAGGMIAKEVALGRRVGIIDLTRGELGSRGTAEDRDQEAYDSAEILGLELRANLGFKDGFFSNDEFHQREIVRYIRLYQPDLVICNAVSDRHPDHGRGSELVSTACFLSGLAKVKTEWESLIQGAWRPKAVYHYSQDRYLKPDVVVDITDFMETKMKAVKAFKTQFYNPESSEPETAISTREFLDFLYGRAMEFGRPAGFKYAEAFTVERTIGIKSLMDLV